MKTLTPALALAAALISCTTLSSHAPSAGAEKAALPPPAIASAPPVARGYAPVNGLRIYYEVHGPDGGTPLVLLHGGDPAIETSWERILPALARTRRVIAFDQQGHGRTADADRPFTFEGSADDTAALLAHLDAVRSIAAPTLVVIGDDDVVRPEHAAELARLLPHARLAVLPLTDHEGVVFAHAGWLTPMVEAFLEAKTP